MSEALGDRSEAVPSEKSETKGVQQGNEDAGGSRARSL
jgi:hypothetical protein